MHKMCLHVNVTTYSNVGEVLSNRKIIAHETMKRKYNENVKDFLGIGDKTNKRPDCLQNMLVAGVLTCLGEEQCNRGFDTAWHDISSTIANNMRTSSNFWSSEKETDCIKTDELLSVVPTFTHSGDNLEITLGRLSLHSEGNRFNTNIPAVLIEMRHEHAGAFSVDAYIIPTENEPCRLAYYSQMFVRDGGEPCLTSTTTKNVIIDPHLQLHKKNVSNLDRQTSCKQKHLNCMMQNGIHATNLCVTEARHLSRGIIVCHSVIDGYVVSSFFLPTII